MMDEKLSEKTEMFMENLCTIAGAGLLMYPLIKQAAKSLSPEFAQLMGDDISKRPPMLEAPKDKPDNDSEEKYKLEHEAERKSHENETSELKRKIAELEGRLSGEQN